MSLTINTNIESMNAQRNLGKSQSDLAKSMQRLSSGLRINSAKDDAAGLAITDRMTAQIRGINQAVRNANDGISLAQTAEGAMQEVTNILQRMRELAVQASNGTYSSSDRSSLQGEMDQLYAEIDRIATSTQFNGVSLLDGTGGTRTFQIGANAGQTVSLELSGVKTSDLHLNGSTMIGELNGGRITSGGAIVSGALWLNDIAISGITASGAASMKDHLNAYTGQTGVTATAYNVLEGSGGNSGIVSGLVINGATVTNSGSMEELVDNINRDVAGVTATLTSEGGLSLTNDTGNTIVVAGTPNNSGLSTGSYTGYLSLSSYDNSEVSLAAADGFTVADFDDLGFNASTGSGLVTGSAVSSAALTTGDLVINGVDIGEAGATAGDKAAAINKKTAETGVKAQALTEVTLQYDGANTANFSINGVVVSGAVAATSGELSTLVDKINATVQGVVATADKDGNLVLTAESGLDIVVTSANGFMATEAGVALAASATYRGTITLTSEVGGDISITGDAEEAAGFVEQGGDDSAIGMGLSVETIDNANNAIQRIDDALNKVADIRADMGAVQNRMESTISNLQNVAENLSAARSRILDADIAAETSAMTKNNILQQAGVSILAQANQAPQLALQLLQG